MTSDLHVLEAGIARVDSIGGTALRDAFDQRFDGSYRTIRLKVTGPARYTVRTKAGYRADPGAP